MSTPLPPLLDGLIGLTQSVIDNSSQRSWSEIEDLEKEQEQQPPPERGKQGATGTTSSRGGSSLSPSPISTSANALPADAAPRSGNSIASAASAGTDAPKPMRSETVMSSPAEPRSRESGIPVRGMGNHAIAGSDHNVQVPLGPAKNEKSATLPVGDIFSRHVEEKVNGARMGGDPVRAPIVEDMSSSTSISGLKAEVALPAEQFSTGFPAESFSAGSSEENIPRQLSPHARQETTATTSSPAPAAIGIEHSLLTSGPVAASQKLHSVIRSMSPEQVSAFLDSASALVASVFEKASEGGQVAEHGPKADNQPKEMRTALAIAHIAASVDKDPRSPSSMRLKQDIAALVLSPSAPNDNTVFTGLAQAIGVGAGAKLALIVAYELAHRQDGRSRSRSLLALMLAGFARLGERIDEAYFEVLRHAGPLCIEWMKWRMAEDGDAVAALIDYLQSEPLLLEHLEPRLEKLEQTGLEAFRAIRDLSAYSFSPELRAVHQELLQSESAFAAISSSRSALKDIRHVAFAAADEGDGLTIDAIQISLKTMGFDTPRAAFLVGVAELGRSTMLGSTWTALESFPQMEARGRTFQRLLAFLNGQYVVAIDPEVVSFDSDDMQAE